MDAFAVVGFFKPPREHPMEPRSLNGFRYSIRYLPDTSAAAMREMVVIAVSRLNDDAVALARAKCPRKCTAQLIGSGPAELKEAHKRGIGEGEAIVLMEREAVERTSDAADFTHDLAENAPPKDLETVKAATDVREAND